VAITKQARYQLKAITPHLRLSTSEMQSIPAEKTEIIAG